MSINEEFALDAVGGNPRPATPFALTTGAGRQNNHSQSNSPRSSAWGPTGTSASIVTVPTFREQEACITETPHFHERTYIPAPPKVIATTNERRDEDGFITEKWSKRGDARDGTLAAAANAALAEKSEGHKQILFRQLLLTELSSLHQAS